MRDPERFKAAVLDYARGTGVPCAAGSHSFSCLMVGYSTGVRLDKSGHLKAPGLSSLNLGSQANIANRACARAQNCFPDHPFEARVWVAIYCWLLTITDDVKHGSTSLDDITRFQERCMRGEPQPSVSCLWLMCGAGLSVNPVSATETHKSSRFSPPTGLRALPSHRRKLDSVQDLRVRDFNSPRCHQGLQQGHQKPITRRPELPMVYSRMFHPIIQS